MRTSLLVFLLAVGCAKPQAPQGLETHGTVSAKPTEAAVYAELWQKCKSKHLKYDIYCYGPSGHCNADAWDNGLDWVHRRDVSSYQVGSYDGPTDAAQQLIKALDGGPNMPADDPRPKFETGEVNP